MKGVEINEESMTKLREIAVTLGVVLSMDSEAVLERLIFALQGDSIFKQIWGDQRMDKREMIERGLGPYLAAYRNQWDALADQAIVIECGVEHHYSRLGGKPYTLIHLGDTGLHAQSGRCGTPGKALAIILPLGKEDD